MWTGVGVLWLVLCMVVVPLLPPETALFFSVYLFGVGISIGAGYLLWYFIDKSQFEKKKNEWTIPFVAFLFTLFLGFFGSILTFAILTSKENRWKWISIGAGCLVFLVEYYLFGDIILALLVGAIIGVLFALLSSKSKKSETTGTKK